MAIDFDRLTTAIADRYAIEREIGSGGMAVVYLAHDLKHNRQVAVKVLRPELSATLGTERFLREIRTVAQLSHPRILPLYDSGEADGFLYYVMPYVAGDSLRQHLDRSTVLPIDEALDIASQVASALDYAHRQGIVHRDIKPENILLHEGEAVVADFGIARALEVAGGDRLTETGLSLGTPQYLSPEQASGGQLDGRSDIYSLACVLYEMLAGDPPFTGQTSRAIIARHLVDPPPNIRTVRQTVPAEVEAAVIRALAKEPADRFVSATEFAESLRRPAIVSTGSSRNRALVRRGAMAVAAALIVAAAGFIGWQLLPGSDTPGPGVRRGFLAQRIAVLYFEDRSTDGGLGHLADGMTEALISKLDTVDALDVISRNGVRPFKEGVASTDSIAKVLGVGSLVLGSVAQFGEVLRVGVELIDAQTGARIARRQFERSFSELFVLQDDIAGWVSSFAASARPARVEAWEALQRARREAEAADTLAESVGIEAAAEQLTRADSLLAEVEAMDPDWANPIVQRGWLAYRQARLDGSFDMTHNDEWTLTGLEHANRALAIDASDADALELRATLLYWRHLLNLPPVDDPAPTLRDGAERDFRASIEANPRQASASRSLSHLLMNKGNAAEAKLVALRSYEADSYQENAHFTVWRLFVTSMDFDDRVEATRWCNEGLARFPNDPRFTECQIWLYAMRGQEPNIPRAWNLLDQYVKLSPPGARDFQSLKGQMLVAMALARAGLADSARAVAERSRGDAEIDPIRDLAYLEASVRSMLGDVDEALRLLSLYLAANPELRIGGQEEVTWWFEGISDDPRYRQLWETEN